jgi:hypothetical protein
MTTFTMIGLTMVALFFGALVGGESRSAGH